MKLWESKPLRALTRKIGSGATPRGGSTVYQDTGVSFIRSKNVLDSRMRLDDLAHLSDAAAAGLAGVSVQPNDVLINITGESVARCCVVDPAVLPARVSQHVAILRASDELAPRYLQAMLVSPSVKAELNGMSSGGTRRALTKAMLANLAISVPPFERQRAIAELLGALDDKIAANAELARTADRLACGLFTRSVAGVESGPRSFGDLCAVGGGGTPKSSEPAFWSGDTDWATPTDVTRLSGPYLRSTAKRITSEGLAACASRLYPVNSILMTSRATIGSFALAKAPMAVNQGFIVVNPTDKSLCCWFLHEMRSRVDEFKSLANGATFLELSRGNFKKLPVRLADPAAMTEFCARAGGLHDLANQALIESDALARLRDTLLPHLMSGRMRVRDAEKTVSDVV